MGKDMILNVQISLSDLYDYDTEYPDKPEKILRNMLKQEVGAEVRRLFTTTKISEMMAPLLSVAEKEIQQNLQDRVKDFMREEVAISDKWGKTTFVGSFEDLIKKEVDELLLYPVNYNGERIRGACSNSESWIVWYLTKETEKYVKSCVSKAQQDLITAIDANVKRAMEEIRDKVLKERITETIFKAVEK